MPADAADPNANPMLRVTAISTTVAVRADCTKPFAHWQARLTRLAGAADGFVSIEMLTALPRSGEWQIVQRFRTPETLTAWQNTAARAGMLAELSPMLEGGPDSIRDEAAPDFHSLTTVTEVIMTDVHPGQEAAFRAWSEAAQAAQSAFPGYMGTLVQAPLSSDVPYWTTLIRFSAPAELEAWLSSSERQAILRRADPAVATFKSQRMPTPFAAWVDRKPDEDPAPVWKQTSVVLAVLFPVILLEIKFIDPLYPALPLPVTKFADTIFSVILVTWPLVPLANAALGWWLRPRPSWRVQALGLAIVVALYALEIFVFTRLLVIGGD